MLLAERIVLREMVNDLFEIQVDVRSKRADVKADEIVGKLADISLDLHEDATKRSWNGLVTELHEAPHVMRGFRRYRLVIRPSLWLLSQHSDCRIWQDKTTADVLTTLMSEHKLPPAHIALFDRVPPQHYSVQWNETDLDYVRRRMEEDAIFFFHLHEPGKHTLAISNREAGYRTSSPAEIRLELGSSDKESISAWSKRYLFTPGVRSGADWNFETPGSVPKGDTRSMVKLPGNANYELYEYPSRISDDEGARRATQLRMQATEFDHERIEGASDLKTLAPSFKFTPRDVNKAAPAYEPHVLLSIEHVMIDHSFEPEQRPPEYSNSFVALPSRLPATPHRQTRRPRLDGTQIGLIAGPPGEEIHTDEYGRVKLWFPWDRRAVKDGSDTCWVRVVQSWGGGGWGAQVIPRIGMEAMVTYLDGDPDRPIVVGLLPNPSKHVTYDLPVNKTKTMFRTNTHKGPGFNELSFEDQNGSQNMLIHAQKDFTQKVLNNQTARVDNSSAMSVGGHASTEVAGNASLQTGGSQSNVVGATGPAVASAMGALSGLTSNTASRAGMAAGLVGGMGAAGSLAMGLIGDGGPAMLSGDGMKGRSGLNDGGTTAADMGQALTGSGAAMLQGVGQLFGGAGGAQHNFVTSMKIDTVGQVRTETVGQVKVTNVGGAYFTGVGHTYQIAVKEKLEIIVGDGAASITMTSDGKISIKGKVFEFDASAEFDMHGKPINLNPPGV